MRKRQGFTLVELLVAMALIIFIMSILSYAFVAATTTFRDLKAAGDMAEKLRSATTVLQRDLAADHFAGRQRLSDPSFWTNGPPRQGFFRIWQGGPGTLEGGDLDGIPLYRSTNHALHFTVHLRGNRLSDQFTAQVPGLTIGGKPNTFTAPNPLSPSPLTNTSATLGPLASRYEDLDPSRSTFNSQWAEVVYFLRPTQDTANGTPLFALYRRQLLLVPDNSLVQSAPNTQAQLSYFVPSTAQPSPYLEVSCWQGYPPGYVQPTTLLYFNSPFDVTVPQRRFGMNFLGLPSTAVAGGVGYPILAEQTSDLTMKNADLLLTDVVSFDVRVLLLAPAVPGADPFVNLFHPAFQGFNNQNSNYYSLPTRPNLPMVFDTWTSLRDPLAGTLTALGPPLNAFAPLYDYSSWGQAGIAANQTPQVSMPLWITNAATNAGSGPIIKAIQIQLRIWDSKTQQTRQVTLVQAM
jgi:prepilin-type N-terminal cleavage/methylation domain-containing protein